MRVMDTISVIAWRHHQPAPFVWHRRRLRKESLISAASFKLSRALRQLQVIVVNSWKSKSWIYEFYIVVAIKLILRGNNFVTIVIIILSLKKKKKLFVVCLNHI